MLAAKLPSEKKEVLAEPKALQVIAIEEGEKPLSFVIPPYEDLTEIEEVSSQHFCLFEFVEEKRKQDQSLFEEFERLSSKIDEFRSSAKYQHRLATLARLSSRFDEEREHARAAKEASDREFYKHRWGDLLIREGAEDSAIAYFRSLNLDDDVVANLRIAALCARKQDFESAEAHVARAVSIDGLDFGVRLFEGALHIVFKRFEKAVQSFRIALQERPGSASAYSNMAIAYLGLRNREKALGVLKKAAALDPLNTNALGLLADVAFSLDRSEDAVPALRYFVSLDQTDASMWSRLARGTFFLKQFDETIEALQHQAAVMESAGVWNNLGVAHAALGHSTRAWSCFHHAMRLEVDAPSKSYFLAAKNVARTLADGSKFAELAAFSASVISKDSGNLIVRDPQLSDLIMLLAYSLVKSKKWDEAEAILVHYLDAEHLNDSLAVWIVSTLAGTHGLSHDPIDIDRLIELYGDKADSLRRSNPSTRLRYFNNVAFALAELGRIEDAEVALGRIIESVHKAAYPTATFGLIQMKKGRLDRAAQLYEEAISLASGKDDKVRIRQKFNLELGKFWLTSDVTKARRFLTKAGDQKFGEDRISSEAGRLLRTLRAPK